MNNAFDNAKKLKYNSNIDDINRSTFVIKQRVIHTYIIMLKQKNKLKSIITSSILGLAAMAALITVPASATTANPTDP